MIFIQRLRPSYEYRRETEYIKYREDLGAFYGTPAAERRQKVFQGSFSPRITNLILANVRTQFMNKCAFCETPVPEMPTSYVAHFRPQRDVLDPVDKSHWTDGYWWLSFVWENLYLSCADCNKYRGTHFPVAKNRVTTPPPNQPDVENDPRLALEENQLIDPCKDIPSKHFRYSKGILEPLDERGAITINVFQLNRPNLVKDRFVEMRQFEKLLGYFKDVTKSTRAPAMRKHAAKIRSFLSELISIFENTTAHCAIKLSLLVDWTTKYSTRWRSFMNAALLSNVMREHAFMVDRLFSLPAFQSFDASVEVIPEKIETQTTVLEKTTTRLFIHKISIKNFKSIRNLVIDFDQLAESQKRSVTRTVKSSATSGGKWLMMLGENSVGKSSVLQAVTLALAGQKYITELNADAREFLTRGQAAGSVKLHLVGIKKTSHP